MVCSSRKLKKQMKIYLIKPSSVLMNDDFFGASPFE